MMQSDIDILTSELSRFENEKTDDIPLTMFMALNEMKRSGHELLKLEKHLEAPEVGDMEALSMLFDSARARVSTSKTIFAALEAQLNRAIQRVQMADEELDKLRQRLSMPSHTQAPGYDFVSATKELTDAISAQTLIELDLEKAKDEFMSAETRLSELLAQRQEKIAQATQRYDRMKETYIAAAAAAAATDVSRHESKTARPVYTFVYDPCVKGAVSTFQEKCLQNPKVAEFIVAPAPLDNDRLEDDFATRLLRTLAPRFEVLLTEVLGLTDVSLKKLSRTYGVDMTLSALMPHDVCHPLVLPIEVKGFLGTGTPHALTEANLSNHRMNARCLGSLCKCLAHLNPLNIWKALTQAAWYIQNEANSNNRGVIFSKDGVLLLHRLNHNTVLVSGLIEYESVDPHPVAALAFWVQESILSPSRVANADYPDTVSVQSTSG
ncbi:hypothetical protein GGI22_001588 [Coemansia erecta]|nr:hypothetical protein GGI22_001588 [Coemansia erecta]